MSERVLRFREKFKLEKRFCAGCQKELNIKERFFGVYIRERNEVKRLWQLDKSLICFECFLKDFEFQHFLYHFYRCPVCKKQNEKDYLKDFFFSKASEKIELREMLLKTLDDSKLLEYSNLLIGIPCCECFNDIFG